MDGLQLPDIKGSFKIKLIDKETGNVDYEQEVNNAIAPWVQTAIKEALICQHMGLSGFNIFNDFFYFVGIGKKNSEVDYFNDSVFPLPYSYATRLSTTSTSIGYAAADTLQPLISNDDINSKTSMLFDFPETVANGVDIDCIFWRTGAITVNAILETRYPNSTEYNNEALSRNQTYQALLSKTVLAYPTTIGSYIFVNALGLYMNRFMISLYKDSSSNIRILVHDLENSTLDFDTYTYSAYVFDMNNETYNFYLDDGCLRIRYVIGSTTYFRIYNIKNKTTRLLYNAIANSYFRYLADRDTFVYAGSASTAYIYSGETWAIKTYSYSANSSSDGTVSVSIDIMTAELLRRSISGVTLSSHAIDSKGMLAAFFTSPSNVNFGYINCANSIQVDIGTSPPSIFYSIPKNVLTSYFTLANTVSLNRKAIIKKQLYYKMTAFAALPSVINKTSAQKIRLEYSFSIPVAVPTYDLL